MERPADAQEKPWGWSLPLWQQCYIRDDGSLAVLTRTVSIGVLVGGYSSVHKHEQQANIFSVIKGKLMLRHLNSEPPYELITEWVQEPGDRPVTFPAGRLHQFKALTDVEALEIYIAIPNGDASSTDIDRMTVNGIAVANDVAPHLPNLLDMRGALKEKPLHS